MKRSTVLIICTLLIASTASAQKNFRLLDSALNLMAEQKMFHGQVLIAENGKVKFSQAYGASREGTPITADTPIDIQSVAKGITALSIMMLHGRGELSINDPIAKYFPDLDYPGVKIKHLLNHTSGLPRFFQMVFENWPQNQFLTTEEMIALAAKLKPEPQSKPGEYEQYNQTAYMILASVVENVTGHTFEIFVRKNIFEPSGMKNTFFNTERIDFKKELGEANLDNLFSLMVGDGNIQSTAEDLAKLDIAIRSGLLISPKIMEQSYVPAILLNGDKSHYGYGGSLIETAKEKRQFQHIGQGITSNAVFTRFIDSGDVLIVLHDQSVQYASPLYAMVKNIWQNKPYKMPSKRTIHTISEELILKYVGDYGDNGFMHITSENNKLYIQPDGNPSKMEIIPSSDTTFYFKDQDVNWEIYFDPMGNVIGFGPQGQKQRMMKRRNN